MDDSEVDLSGVLQQKNAKASIPAISLISGDLKSFDI